MHHTISLTAPPEELTRRPAPEAGSAATNRDAFEVLYAAYFPRVYHYCARRTASLQEAEDVTSLVFIRALASFGEYRGGSMVAWLFRIAHNAIANHWRDRRPTVSIDHIADRPADDDPLHGVVDDEERRHLAQLISALPEDQRELLALKIAGGLTAKEIGQVIGKSEGAVRLAFHRIVRQLRAAWAAEASADRTARENALAAGETSEDQVP